MTVSYEKLNTDFPNDVFNEDSLKQEIAAKAEITTELVGITSHEDVETEITTVYFIFESGLSAGELTALDEVVAAHQGNPPTVVVFHASSKLTDQERETVDTDPGWTELGGAVTSPGFFVGYDPARLAACKGRVVGEFKTNGTGAKLRLHENGTEPSSDHELPDSGGEWAKMQWFSPDAPTEGTHLYKLEGQLPVSGATELWVKYVAVSLLEFTTEAAQE
jgi:hypothetical protein